MPSLIKKTLEVSRGLTYAYYTSPAAPSKPTVLLIHGFPDASEEWLDLAETHLIPSGYGVIIPDCLGYGGSSKPLDPATYKFRKLINDFVKILDAEKVHKVVSMGHDWGSTLAQRVYNLAPSRVEGLAMVNVAYYVPSNQAFDLDAYLALTEKFFGYGTFWYWKLLAADDGAELLNKHLTSMFEVIHAPGEQLKDTMCAPDGLKNFLERDGRSEVQAYATEEMRKEWIARFERDGFEAPCCYYKAQVQGFQMGEADEDNVVVNVPALFFGFDNDIICRKELSIPSEQKGLLPQLTKVDMEGSHWGFLDKKKEFGEAVVA